MTNDHSNDAVPAMFKVLLAWAGAVWGSLTLQGLVLTLTAIYTAVQLYVLVRDKIIRDKRG